MNEQVRFYVSFGYQAYRLEWKYSLETFSLQLSKTLMRSDLIVWGSFRAGPNKDVTARFTALTLLENVTSSTSCISALNSESSGKLGSVEGTRFAAVAHGLGSVPVATSLGNASSRARGSKKMVFFLVRKDGIKIREV